MERRHDGVQLVTANPADRVALRGVRLSGRVSGLGVRAVVEQTFVNLEGRAIEAVYTFPLPEGAAVCGFEVVTGDRVLTGVVEEAEEAIEKYDDAVGRGDGAYLLEQERPDVFTARVGNLRPGQAATIRLTLVMAAEVVDRVCRLSFPTTVAPRYVTDSGQADKLLAAVDGEALNPPHVLSVPYGLTLEMEVDLGREVLEVASPTHAVNVERREGHARVVRFAGGVAEMDRDLVLTVALRREQRPVVQAAAGPDGAHYLAVTFVPEFDVAQLEAPPATETVFLLDCSGSMMGESIGQAKSALELCLRSMSAGDRFNVCRFGSSHEMLASEPLAYGDETLRRAIGWVRASGDLGGTEVYEPLKAILSRAPAVGRVRTVVVLTDGQVSNEPAVLELARQHRAQNRVFSFGIGSASSQFLVRGLARATGGAAEFIAAGERIEEKVLRTFGRIASPAVTDVAIDWGGADVQTLADVPPVFDGDALTVYGRCAGALPAEVTLRCVAAGAETAWSVRVGAPVDDDGVIARMWARRAIQSLEEVNGVRRTSVSERREHRARAELVRLSKQFGVVCSLTTFLAVEHRSVEERNEGRPALRRVPVRIAKDWGGMDVGTGLSGMVAGAAMPAMAPDVLASLAPAPAKPGGFMARLRGFKKGLKSAAVPPPPALAAPAQSAGGGSGLLDLCREGDDTSFGVVLHDGMGVGDRLPPPTGSMRPAERPGIDKTIELSELDPETRAKFEAAHAASVARDAAEREAEAALTAAEGGPRGITSEEVLAVLATQSASGAFAVTDEALARLFAAVGAPMGAWRRAVESPPVAGAPREDGRVVTTLLVLVLLRLACTDRADLWRRAWQKALRFVATDSGMTAERVEMRVVGLFEKA